MSNSQMNTTVKTNGYTHVISLQNEIERGNEGRPDFLLDHIVVVLDMSCNVPTTKSKNVGFSVEHRVNSYCSNCLLLLKQHSMLIFGFCIISVVLFVLALSIRRRNEIHDFSFLILA
jgi:hypothetical protein